jgi:hypothetical protein
LNDKKEGFEEGGRATGFRTMNNAEEDSRGGKGGRGNFNYRGNGRQRMF